jgi:mycothiol system anti-sigma-R factor
MWRRRAASSGACRGVEGMSEDVGRSEESGGVEGGGLFGVTVDCEEAVHELYYYLDGELTEERREEIRVHLDWCGPCNGAADFEAELRKVIANRCRDRVPESLIRRVAEAIDEESRQRHGGH